MKIQRDQQNFPGLTKYAEVFGGFDEEIKGRNVTVSSKTVSSSSVITALSSGSSVINDKIVTIIIITIIVMEPPWWRPERDNEVKGTGSLILKAYC